MQPQGYAPIDEPAIVSVQPSQLISPLEGAPEAESTSPIPYASPTAWYPLSLPEPEHRRAAGSVRRRTDNTVRALPPPPNSRQAALTAPKQGRDRRRQPKGPLGAGSGYYYDSESNFSEDPDDDEPNFLRRRQTICDRHQNESYKREERARMKPFQVPQKVGSQWDTARQHRQGNLMKTKKIIDFCLCNRCQENSKTTEEIFNICQLNHRLRNTWYVKPPNTVMLGREYMHRRITEWDRQLDLFLDEALFGDVEEKLREEGQSTEGAGDPLDYLEDMIFQVEQRVIRRFSEDSRDRIRKWDRTEVSPNLARVICSRALWVENLLQGVQGGDLVSAAMDLMRDRFLSHNPDASDAMSILEGAYLANICRAIAGSLLNGNMAAEIERSELVTQIRSSRSTGNLQPHYIDWIYSVFSTRLIQDSCLQWRKELRRKTVQTYRDTMKSVGLRQEFWYEIAKPRVVSLVLLTGNYPETIRDLREEDLAKIGWFSAGFGAIWYRYQRRRMTDRPFGMERIFLIDMDESIVGMWTPERGEIIGPKFVEYICS